MKYTYLILLLLVFSVSFAQNEKKTVNAVRVDKGPTIDGTLNEPLWNEAMPAKDFVMFLPGDGTKERPNKKSEVKVVYNNEAIYFGATLYDNEPEKIPLQFTSRDEFGNTDLFVININPLNNGQDETRFVVMSTGAQADLKVTGGREDLSWNDVWSSAVKINKDSWTVEIKIPYSALRFGNTEVQTWGINFLRKINYLNEEYVWNYVNRTKGDYSQYTGDLTGLKNLKPPVRLSFYPYASGTYTNYDGEGEFNESFGLDLKYGISESFTINATLIPDFGQTAFDDQVLNLGPFEQRYSEKRAFFIEGTELFDKGGLFYSRRIGNTPVGYDSVEENLQENEEILENPSNVNMTNAVKLSGRTKKGLGIGFFNAITENTYAKIKNTETEEVRRQLTEPLANYNVFVLDQQFNKNSSVSFVNTNVLREGSFRDANVSAFLYDLSDKQNKFNLRGNLKLSHVYDEGEKTNGFAGFIRASKNSGNLQFGAGYSTSDENYDIKDLGFQRRNDYSSFFSYISYQIFEPTKNFNKYRISVENSIRYLYGFEAFTSSDMEIDAFFVTTKRLAFGADVEFNIGDSYDYNEPRVEGRFFRQNGVFESGAWISTDYRKKFAIDGRLFFATRYNDPSDFRNFSIEPRYRFSDKFQMIYALEYGKLFNEKGYVTELDNGDIIFGNRDVKNVVNTLSGKYSFSTKSSLTLSFRYYWSPVVYDDLYYTLNDDGLLDDSTYSENNDINYNVWNLDLNYSWEFAPGSFLVALYRNSIFNSDDMSDLDFGDNLNNLFDEPMNNVVSLKLIYFLDYNKMKTWF